MPAGAHDPAKFDADAVYAEFLRRAASGDPQNFSDLCNQHPQLAGQLLDLHDRCETIGVPDPAPTTANGAGAPVAGSPLQHATQRYGILERLAHGGMGIIYRAWDGTLRRELAMKLIRDKKNRESHEPATSVSPETLARFVREAEITARLDHPGVVPIHDMGTDDHGRVFFTMRLVQGQRLDIVFELARMNVKRWSQTRVLDVIVKICETVAFAHSRGVIHRDLKPMNIMVGRFGETYVMDWGLAKILRDHRGKVDPIDNADLETVIYEEGGSSSRIGTSDLMPMSDSDLETKAGAVLGTAAYMPPEQAAGQISLLDERSDIYSVGAILYELLAGRRPYSVPDKPIARTREVVSAVIAGPPAPITSAATRVPAELVAICEKAMERRKEDRYQNMTEMAEDLRAYLENRVVRAHQTGAIAELRKWVSRNRWTAIASATAVALLAAVAGVQLAANKKLSAKNVEITNANTQITRETTLKEQALTLETQARQRADRELARAEGLILARASADVVATNPGQALLVALESARRQPSDAANTALLAALASHHEAATFRGHQAPIRTAIISQDGTRAATASVDRTVIVWDLVARQPITWLLGHSEIVNSVQFSPDAKRIATGSYDSTARIWDANSGQLLVVMKGHQKLIWRVAFNPAGDRLATASFDGTARIWDAATGNPILTVQGHAAEVLAVEFSADGRRLLTGSADRTARLWDAVSGIELAQMPGHDGGVGSAQFNPDGSQVLTIAPLPSSDLAAGKEFSIPSTERAARLWSAETGQPLAVLRHPEIVLTSEFSHDGRRAVTGSTDGFVRIWNIATGEVERTIAARGGAVHAVDFSPDDRLILAGTESGKAWLWDADTGHERALLGGHSEGIRTAAFASADAILTASVDRSARLWNARSPGMIAPVATGDYRHNSIEISSDGTRLLVRPVASPRIVLQTVPEGNRIASFEHESTVRDARFSPAGSFVATWTETGIVRVFSARDGQMLKMLEGTGKATQFAFDGESRLVVCDLNGAVTTWDLTTWSREKRHDFAPRKVLVSPDGRRLVAWFGTSRDLEFWNTESMTMIASHQAAAGAPREPAILTFGSDGRKLVTSTSQLWDVSAGRLIATLDLEGAQLSQSSFSSDGTVVVSRFSNAPARLWDAETGTPISRLSGHEPSFQTVYSGPTGDRVVTLSRDKLSRLWNGRTGKSLGLLADRDDFVQAAFFSADGRLLLTLNGKSENGCLWDAVENRRVAQVFSGKTAFMHGAVSPDGRWFVLGCKDGSARICPANPVDFVHSLGLRELTPDERDLFEIGSLEERLQQRIDWNRQALITVVELAARITAPSERQQAAIRAAIEGRLREFIQLNTPPATSTGTSRLTAVEEAVSSRTPLTPPVAAAFAAVKAEISPADRGK